MFGPNTIFFYKGGPDTNLQLEISQAASNIFLLLFGRTPDFGPNLSLALIIGPWTQREAVAGP